MALRFSCQVLTFDTKQLRDDAAKVWVQHRLLPPHADCSALPLQML